MEMQTQILLMLTNVHRLIHQLLYDDANSPLLHRLMHLGLIVEQLRMVRVSHSLRTNRQLKLRLGFGVGTFTSVTCDLCWCTREGVDVAVMVGDSGMDELYVDTRYRQNGEQVIPPCELIVDSL
jgi:hypothetical protein